MTSASKRVKKRRLHEKLDDRHAGRAQAGGVQFGQHAKVVQARNLRALKYVNEKLDKTKEEIEKLKDKIKKSVENIELLKKKLVEYESHLEKLRTDFKGKFGSGANVSKSALEEKDKIFQVMRKKELKVRKIRDSEGDLMKMKKNLKSLNAEYLLLDEEKFREILPEVEPSRAEAWEASDAREETAAAEKRDALSWNALGATRGNMDFLSMINAFERSEREPDIVEAEAALVPTNAPIAVSLDARLPKTSWADGREVTVATRAPVLGSVVAKPLTMTDRAREKMSRKRTTTAEARLVEGGRKSRRRRKSRGKKRTHKKKKKIRKKKQTRRKKLTRKRRKIRSFSLPAGNVLDALDVDDAFDAGDALML